MVDAELREVALLVAAAPVAVREIAGVPGSFVKRNASRQIWCSV